MDHGRYRVEVLAAVARLVSPLAGRVGRSDGQAADRHPVRRGVLIVFLRTLSYHRSVSAGDRLARGSVIVCCDQYAVKCHPVHATILGNSGDRARFRAFHFSVHSAPCLDSMYANWMMDDETRIYASVSVISPTPSTPAKAGAPDGRVCTIRAACLSGACATPWGGSPQPVLRGHWRP